MPDCVFCGQHAVSELNVPERTVDGQVQVPLCEDCTESYDEWVETYK